MKIKVDYTPHYLEAEKKMKDAHDCLKVGKFEEASLLIEGAIVELRLMQIAVKSQAE